MSFSVKVFIEGCFATLAQFKKEEIKKRPENALLLRTPTMINQDFKRVLDEVKLEVGLEPEEVYITVWSESRISVKTGATLLSMEVVFDEKLDLEKLRERRPKKTLNVLFEKNFISCYNRCVRRFDLVKKEIAQAWNARVVGRSEIDRAISHLEEVRTERNKNIVLFTDLHLVGVSKEKLEQDFKEIGILLRKLKQIRQEYY